jgi:hypothetical protein
MPLYRALYVTNNRPHRFTVHAKDPQSALDLAEKLAPAPVLTLEAVRPWTDRQPLPENRKCVPA